MFIYKRYSTRDWKYIIIHHSQTKDGNAYDWYSIDRYHSVEKGWSEIGYHFGIELVNGDHRLCMGRSLSKGGGHTKGYFPDDHPSAGRWINGQAIGICVVGNYDVDELVVQQYWLLASLCRDLMDDFKIPIQNIVPHSDFSDKTCPGKLFNMGRLKDTIQGHCFAGG